MRRIPWRRPVAALAALTALGGTATFFATNDSGVPSATAEESPNVIHYQVVDGDTWANIAARYNLSAGLLAAQNGQTSQTPQPRRDRVLHVIPGAPPTTTLPPTTTVALTTLPPSTTTTSTTTTVAPTTTTTTPSGAQFVETFDNDTGLDRFNLHVFQRNVDADNWYGWPFSPPTYPGDHNTVASNGLSCGDPSTSRNLNYDVDFTQAQRQANAFYVCRDHLMTAMGDVDAYSITGFSPKQVFPSVRRVCFDVNLTNLGSRQWWKVGVVTDALYNTTKGYQGRVPGWIMSDVDASNVSASLATSSVLIASYAGGLSAGMPGFLKIGNTGTNVSFTAGSDKATRYPSCLTDNRNGTITFQVGPVSATRNGAFPAGPVRVVFMDHDYTPDKSTNEGWPFSGYTWHWDNIIVE